MESMPDSLTKTSWQRKRHEEKGGGGKTQIRGALLLLDWETAPLHTKKLTGPWQRTQQIGSILGLNAELVPVLGLP